MAYYMFSNIFWRGGPKIFFWSKPLAIPHQLDLHTPKPYQASKIGKIYTPKPYRASKIAKIYTPKPNRVFKIAKIYTPKPYQVWKFWKYIPLSHSWRLNLIPLDFRTPLSENIGRSPLGKNHQFFTFRLQPAGPSMSEIKSETLQF